jgi:hypothetical protein
MIELSNKILRLAMKEDGTRVVANVSDAPVETLDYGVLPPNSWREA